MNMDKLNDWLQLVGMAAVVASLVFVGLQLKQSQEIAIAAQYQARFDSTALYYTTVLQSDPAMRVVGQEVLDALLSSADVPSNMKAWATDQPIDELAYRAVTGVMQLKVYDNLHYQYQAGFISEEAWHAIRIDFRKDLMDPRRWARLVYERKPDVWRDSYRELIHELIDENESAVQ